MLVFLMLPASVAIWECVPGMAYLQFPWRLLGPANMMLAVCAAGGAALLPRGLWRNPVLAAALAATLLLALPVLYPPMWAPDFGPTAPQDIIEWERHSLALGTTSTGDFLPVGAARVRMRPQSSLVESYTQPGPVDRVNRASLPDGAAVEIVEHGPLHDRFAVSAPVEFVLRLYTFHFPGWRAYVDGQEVEIEVATPEGFITVRVPAGEHEVVVRFEDTPPRTAGWVISALGLAALLVALTQYSIPNTQYPVPNTQYPIPNTIPNTQPPTWFAAVLFLFVLLKIGVIDPRDGWMRYTSPPGQAWAAQHERRADFGGQIELLGYDLPGRPIRSGERFPVVLYWHALGPVDSNYQSFVHLARPLHILWGQQDNLNPGGLPTSRWPLDKYVWDEHEIEILPGTPPGEYALNVGLYSMDGGYRLQRYDEGEQAVGDSLVIASLEVERPRRQPRLADLGMTHVMTVTFPEGGVTLLGYAQPYPKVKLPGAWPLTLFWRADRDHPAARHRDLVLLDPGGNEVWRSSGPPGGYPFQVWQAGEIVRDPLLFTAASPVSLMTDKYVFGVTVSADDPLNPEGPEGMVDDPFVPLGRVKFRVKENE